MTPGPIALLVASGVQGGGAHPESAHDTLQVLVALFVFALAGGVTYVLIRRRRRRPPPVDDQWRALAVMGELCPYGWQAQVTLYGWGAPVPDDAPPSRVPLVALEWTQYAEEPGRIAVARRVWAPTISDALELMVEDRRTDVALEEIEREGWWDG